MLETLLQETRLARILSEISSNGSWFAFSDCGEGEITLNKPPTKVKV